MVVTSILFTESTVINAWKQHQAWPVQINAYFVGGKVWYSFIAIIKKGESVVL